MSNPIVIGALLALSFCLGVAVGIFLPLVVVRMYNAIGGSLNELCVEEEDVDAGGNR